MECKESRCKRSTPSLEGWPTKAKEAPSPHELRLAPAGHQLSILMLWGNLDMTA